MNPALLNQGLNLAMEWGKEWLQPIQKRLSNIHPALSNSELDQLNDICQQAMRRGHQLACNSAMFLCVETPIFEKDKLNGKASREKFQRLREEFEKAMRNEYPWIDDHNIGRLFSQGVYYGMK